MSSTECLSGVVAYIVSHSDGVVNDKAALTQRLASMGATVAGRFSGLVTHIIFRRKPHASNEERLAEGQALFDLYNRIDKVSLPLSSARSLLVQRGRKIRFNINFHHAESHWCAYCMQATQQRRGVIQFFIVEPFWIEACFSSGTHAPVRPLLHASAFYDSISSI